MSRNARPSRGVTTKRAGSDKKTAFAVGERYAHKMVRLNEAVEALKRRHASERERGRGRGGGMKEMEANRRGRLRSVDGGSVDCVTFATSFAPPRLSSLAGGAVAATSRDGGGVPSNAKRDRPLGGIVKSGSKQCRAASFDVSTGPSVVAPSPSRLHRCWE